MTEEEMQVESIRKPGPVGREGAVISVSIPWELLDRTKEAAKGEGRSLSNFIATSVEMRLRLLETVDPVTLQVRVK